MHARHAYQPLTQKFGDTHLYQATILYKEHIVQRYMRIYTVMRNYAHTQFTEIHCAYAQLCAVNRIYAAYSGTHTSICTNTIECDI